MVCVALADADRRHQEGLQLRRFKQLHNCLGTGRRPRATPALSPMDWDHEPEPSPHPGPGMSPPAPSPYTIQESSRLSQATSTSMASIPESELHQELVRDVAKLYTSKLFADLVFMPPAGTMRAMVGSSSFASAGSGGARPRNTVPPWQSPPRGASPLSESDEDDDGFDEWATVEAHRCIVWARAPKLMELLGLAPATSPRATTSSSASLLGDEDSCTMQFVEVELPEWLPVKALRVLLAYCYTDDFSAPGWDNSVAHASVPYPYSTVKQLVVVANLAKERLELPALHIRCLQAVLRGVNELERAVRVFAIATDLRGEARKYVQVGEGSGSCRVCVDSRAHD